MIISKTKLYITCYIQAQIQFT